MKYALTIGSYDGVHLGHKKILDLLTNYAKRNSIKSAVIYFPIPPKLYIHKNFKNNLITTPDEREKLIKNTGIDEIVKINFNKRFSRKNALEFFTDFIVKKLDPEYIVVGRDFSMGRDRQANYLWLKEICKINSIKCKILNFVKYRKHKISSSLIRHFLHSAMILEANECLGRSYSVCGMVVKGAQLGRKLGYPTANIEINPLKILPRGIYAVKVKLGDKKYNGVSSIGIRPTLKTLDMKVICEVHILNFSENIYNKKIEVFFINKLRNEMKFNNLKELANQISIDIKNAKKFF